MAGSGKKGLDPVGSRTLERGGGSKQVPYRYLLTHLIPVRGQETLEFFQLVGELPGAGEDDLAQLHQPLLGQRRLERHHPKTPYRYGTVFSRVADPGPFSAGNWIRIPF